VILKDQFWSTGGFAEPAIQLAKDICNIPAGLLSNTYFCGCIMWQYFARHYLHPHVIYAKINVT